MHKELGKCNSRELCKMLEQLNPDVIFLEALEETYSKYEKQNFKSFRVPHKKLEIRAIQEYSLKSTFEYVPVLDNGLSEAFANKYKSDFDSIEYQKFFDTLNNKAFHQGFCFLNSQECISLHEEMRKMESQLLLNNPELEKAFKLDIDEYENAMLQNIYSYCEENIFDSAVFLCGSAHRKSIIEKTKEFNEQEGVKINWELLKFE
jgi:hypothetical protein